MVHQDWLHSAFLQPQTWIHELPCHLEVPLTMSFQYHKDHQGYILSNTENAAVASRNQASIQQVAAEVALECMWEAVGVVFQSAGVGSQCRWVLVWVSVCNPMPS